MPSSRICPLLASCNRGDWRHPPVHTAVRGASKCRPAEQRFHAEGARFIGNDGHNEFSEFRIAEELGEDAHERHGSRDFPAFAAFVKLREQLFRRRDKRGACHAAFRDVAGQFFTAAAEVEDFRAVIRRQVKRRFGDVFIRDGDSEARAEFLQLVFVHLLLLMRDVFSLAASPRP